MNPPLWISTKMAPGHTGETAIRLFEIRLLPFGEPEQFWPGSQFSGEARWEIAKWRVVREGLRKQAAFFRYQISGGWPSDFWIMRAVFVRSLDPSSDNIVADTVATFERAPENLKGVRLEAGK